MTVSDVHPRATGAARRRSPLLIAAFAAFLVANVIHNRYGLDPAIAPSALFVALHAWRPHRGFLWAAAVFLALPGFLFLDVPTLLQPSASLRFVNHAALFLAGVLAVLAVALDFRAGRRAAPRA